jgi:hypothetical protein
VPEADNLKWESRSQTTSARNTSAEAGMNDPISDPTVFDPHQVELLTDVLQSVACADR